MGSSNYFKCPHCGNNTRHVLVSFEEDFGNNTGRVGGIIGKLYDCSGLTNLFQAIGNKVWKCTSCLGLSNRDHGGGIVHVRTSWSEGWKDYVEYNNGYYMGDYVNHKRHGRGKFIWACGDVYDGEWHDDKKHGRGKYIWASGATYDGEWNNGNMHGHGEYTWADGSKRKGVWVNEKLDHWLE